MATGRPDLDHLLRRAGFGASPEESAFFRDLSLSAATDYLIDYEREPDDADAKIGQSDYLGYTTNPGSPFRPNHIIDDARQRWLFRMVHTWRPLQEKMTLFWHNHFATGRVRGRPSLYGMEHRAYVPRRRIRWL